MQKSVLYNEKALLRQIAAGDETAFRVLYVRHWNRIYSMALLYLKNPLAAQDAVQDVFEQLWLKRTRLADVDNMEAWLYVLGKNYILSALRKKALNIQDHAPSQDHIPETAIQADLRLTVKEVTAAIHQAVSLLPPQQKAVFLLSREEGIPLKEVAAKLGISYSTAREYMSLALKFLRKYLATHLHELPMILGIFFF